jgi:GxxExxY protein
MAFELGNKGLAASCQEPITVRYRGELIGEFVADIVVEAIIIVELKSVQRVVKAYVVQLIPDFRGGTATDISRGTNPVFR